MTDPEVGKRYRVAGEDCCVSVDFTATLVGGDLEYGHYEFDNGVRASGLTFRDPEVEDTLPRWLYQRFHCPGTYWIETYGHSADWNDLKPEDQAYWLHEAAAVRRAVARDGFKEKA